MAPSATVCERVHVSVYIHGCAVCKCAGVGGFASLLSGRVKSIKVEEQKHLYDL